LTAMPFNRPIELSICIVALNAWDVLEACLESLPAAVDGLSAEVIVVDNNSSDGTADHLLASNPGATLVRNRANIGFTRATNQAIRRSSGSCILWLNPDTILTPSSLRRLWGFLQEHPDAGIVGPKVLNGDHTFQPQCRRGLPTPWAAICHVVGLDRLRPRSPRFSEYLLTYLPPDETSDVTAVSGCCLLARRDVWDQVGPLDEEIFGFGEDVDWCLRAKSAGWRVCYFPGSTIVHLKGRGGAHAKPYHMLWGLHQALWIVYRKHFMARYPKGVTAVVLLGIAGKFLLSVGGCLLASLRSGRL
jgi:GT2 family glycosyltransferase